MKIANKMMYSNSNGKNDDDDDGDDETKERHKIGKALSGLNEQQWERHNRNNNNGAKKLTEQYLKCIDINLRSIYQLLLLLLPVSKRSRLHHSSSLIFDSTAFIIERRRPTETNQPANQFAHQVYFIDKIQSLA